MHVLRPATPSSTGPPRRWGRINSFSTCFVRVHMDSSKAGGLTPLCAGDRTCNRVRSSFGDGRCATAGALAAVATVFALRDALSGVHAAGVVPNVGMSWGLQPSLSIAPHAVASPSPLFRVQRNALEGFPLCFDAVTAGRDSQGRPYARLGLPQQRWM